LENICSKCRRIKKSEKSETIVRFADDYSSNINLILCDISTVEEKLQRTISAELERIYAELDRIHGKSCVFSMPSAVKQKDYELIGFLNGLSIRRFAEKFISEEKIKSEIINSAELFSRGLMTVSDKVIKQQKKDDGFHFNGKRFLMQSLVNDSSLPHQNGYNRRRSHN